MSSERIRVALVGAGRIGRIHAEHAVGRIPDCRLVAVADVDGRAARECGEALGVQKIYESPDRVFDDREIDALLLCSATHTHVPLIERAAQAGKHVFCEKPLALDLPSVDRAIAAADRANIRLQVGFNRRFDPSFQEVRAALESGRIGRPHLVRITSRDPSPPSLAYLRVSGGLFLDMTIHDFDMARFLLAEEVTRVSAVAACLEDGPVRQAGDLDTAVVTLTFASGAFAMIDNSRRAVYGYDQRVEVFCSEGMAWADHRLPHTTGHADSQGLHRPTPLYSFSERYREAYLAELAHFVTSIREGRKPAVTGADARAATLLSLAAALSARESRTVRPDEIQ